MKEKENILQSKISAFKKKYYWNQFIRQSITFVAIIFSAILILTSIEFSFELGTSGRTFLFYGTIIGAVFTFYKWVFRPYLKVVRTVDQISDEEASEIIGEFFPELKDKLLNTIQLQNNSSQSESLVLASIEKRTEEISPFHFTQSVDFKTNKKYLKYAAYPGLLIFILLIFVPQFLTESTNRIVNYDKEFKANRLFTIAPVKEKFTAYRNENFELEVKVSGQAIPSQLYVNAQGRKSKLTLKKDDIYSYVFTKVQSKFEFRIEAADYQSPKYLLEVLQRPDIRSFQVNINYPTYTGIKNNTLENTGNLTIPEGSNVEWMIQTMETDHVALVFAQSKETIPMMKMGNQLFQTEKKLQNSDQYELKLNNSASTNKDSIIYHIDVVKDQHPKISLDYYQDTTLYAFIIFSGLISDDYGITNLEFVMTRAGQPNEITSIPINRKLKSQNYFYQWNLNSLKLKEGEHIDYYVRVWDNDQVNGRKYTQSASYSFKLPKTAEIKEIMDKESEGEKDDLEKSLQEAKDLNKQIKEIQNDLKTQEALDWKKNKKLSDLTEQKEQLEKQLKEIAEQNKALAQKQEQFNQPNEKLQEKAKQLQNLMDELLDDETKQLYEELKKLLEEQGSPEDISETMDQIENREENLEKEIERAIEMFKRMQFDFKMEEIINDLEKLQQEQSELSEETKDKKNDLDDIQEKQKELDEKFDQIQKEMDQLEKLNENMKQPEQLDDLSQEEKDIEEAQEESQENLEKQKRKASSQSQKNAADKMQKMKEKMESMQMDMEMSMMQENLDNLRDIIDNLIKISFDQEQVMVDIKEVNQSDPRYILLSQTQLKIKDDAIIIEDSLLSLAGRVFQIQSFVTRELDDMNDHISASLQGLKDRKKPIATTHQQYSMTSINNLALLLDDVLQQMQQQMAEAMGKPQKGDKGKKQNMPGMSELQKQLNKKISDLKKSGKTGRPLSKELSELASEQEMLRNQLKKIEGDLGEEEGGASGNLKEAMKKMEQTEMDLVNKRLTQQTIQRQKDILTRMLKAENAIRERELDKKREANTAKDRERNIPPEFEDYIKAKQQELELLNTVPPNMNPYYKDEANKYFRRLNKEE